MDRRAFWRWAAVGFGAGLFLVWIQSLATGGIAGLLQVGETSNLRPLIENQLGSIPIVEGPGHDGQIFYAIALDLSGDEVGPLLDHASYRYRRILFPLVASFGGVLDGWALLYSMIAMNLLAFAGATGLLGAWVAGKPRPTALLPLVVLLNPGMWLSVQLLTSDATSVALMVAGLWWISPGIKSDSLFALSGLAKDVSLATPLPLSLERPRRISRAIVPLAALGGWMLYLELTLGDGFASRGNLDWPFAGIVTASSNWATLDGREWVFLAFALLSAAFGAYFSLKRTWLRLPIAAWTLLAVISSNWVWDFGNNAARAFAPIIVLVAIAGAQPTAEASASERFLAGTR